MVGLNQSLFTGFSGVQTAQVGLNVTGNNIANVNTPGYSKQLANSIPKGVFRTQGLTMGTGADVIQIGAARETLANDLLTAQEGRTTFAEQLASGFNDIETLLGETDTTGVAARLNDFFESMEAATQRPSDIAARENLLVTADNLATEIRGRDADLYELQTRTDTDIQELVNRINEIAVRIEDLNRQISTQPDPAQDLIDDRYQQINEISKLIGVETFELDNNQIQINILGPNQILVGREMRNTLQVSTNPANNGFFNVELDVKGTVTDITNQIVTGDIGARIQLRDQEIQPIRDRLDNLAAGLIIEMNTVHQAGFDLNGNTNIRFFDPDNATVLGATPIGTVDATRYQGMAGAIQLSTDLLVDPLDPAQGYDATALALSATGAFGDNGVALQMAGLRNSTDVIDVDRDGDPTNDTGAGSFERYHSDTLAFLGGRTRSANLNLDTQQALLEQAEVRREQVSGVSLDEEAVSLNQYQRAFEASSRFLSVINQLTGEILNRLGS
ncbi:MAG: flagellar hook-associated protein FlgK [Acidobacteriota bacterium]|nr:flagellar hook-associated protein FlgK [Acidobacteriota bacterium]